MNVPGTGVTLEPSAHSSTLSMWRADFRTLCEQILPLVTAQLFEKCDGPVYSPVPADIRDAFLDTPLPQEGCSMASIVNDVAHTILPYPSPNGHPLSVAWCGSPPAPLGVLGHFLLAAMNSLCSLSAVVAFFYLHEFFSPTMYIGEGLVLLGVVLQTNVGLLSDYAQSRFLGTWYKHLRRQSGT